MRSMMYQNGNPVRKNGRFVYIEEKECVKQRLIIALKLWKNEWFLYTGKAIDWHSLLQDKPASDRKIRVEVTAILSQDSEVSSVESVSISYDGKLRKITIEFSVQTLYGTVGGTV